MHFLRKTESKYAVAGALFGLLSFLARGAGHWAGSLPLFAAQAIAWFSLLSFPAVLGVLIFFRDTAHPHIVLIAVCMLNAAVYAGLFYGISLLARKFGRFAGILASIAVLTGIFFLAIALLKWFD